MGKVKKTRPNGTGTTRSSFRLYQKEKKLKQAVKGKNENRRECLRVARTVEMVDQTNELWREEKSKLLFTLALGLTPVHMQAVIQPSINLEPIPRDVYKKAKEEYDRRQLEAQNKARAERQRRIAKKREWRYQDRKRRTVVASVPESTATARAPELIDLISDDEDEVESNFEVMVDPNDVFTYAQSDYSDQSTEPYILPDYQDIPSPVSSNSLGLDHFHFLMPRINC